MMTSQRAPTEASRVPAPNRSLHPSIAGSIRPIFVNCRIAGGRATGVHRYLSEMLAGMGEGLTQVRPLGKWRGPAGHLWEQFALPSAARGLLWSPSNTGPIGLRDQVVTIHDVASLDHPEWFRPAFARWYRFMTPRLVRCVRLVIADSEFTKSRILEWVDVDPDKIVVIPLGVGRAFRPPTPGESESLRRKYPALCGGYVLSLGSLEPRKNLARLFAAWERVSAAAPGLVLAVAGSPGRIFAGTGIASSIRSVEFLGYPDDIDLPALYGNAEAFAYPSLYEGFGLPPLEAMACGAPTVASDTGAVLEVVGEAAVLVDPLDVDSIAAGLLRVIGDPSLRDDLRLRGLERARDLSWGRAAARTLEVLRDAADSV